MPVYAVPALGIAIYNRCCHCNISIEACDLNVCCISEHPQKHTQLDAYFSEGDAIVS